MKTLLNCLCAAAVVAAVPMCLFANGQAIELHLEDDLKQVRVEARDTDTGRWLAIASGYRDHANPGWLRIALPDEYAGSDLRVLGSTQVSPFAGKVNSAAGGTEGTVDYPPSPNAYVDSATGGPERGGSGEEPVIEEADIWAWNGSTLFFYNQYRGLQVIGMADPVNPEWLDYYRYPARGEDLYATGDGRIVLIGTGSYWRDDNVALQMLRFDGSSLSHDETVELEAGQYLDSRRYGDYLYVMTREWVTEIDPNGDTSRNPRIRLYTIALSDTAPRRIVDVKTYNSNGWLDAVLTAQPDGILISLNRWYNHSSDWRFRWRSEVHVLVPAENGVPEEVGVARLSGILHDKFKMQYKDGLLTTISQQADWMTGVFTRATMLENFQLGDSGFRKVGSLSLAPGETLFATRFYEDTVYIVTFLFVDPLFAIDNSNPAKPRIAGELEVPGWSNYIEWVDDQLFAVGLEDRKLTVSIFDVADPEKMSLKDRVYLNEDSWAYSEAQYDDQAISIFPDAGILMLPFTTWSWTSSEMIQAMQLVSWDDTGLQLRGAIQHLDVPRRGTLRGDTVFTISGREVVTTDITDPDLPVEGGSATLAWNVTKLIPHDDYLLQLEVPGENSYWIWRSPYNPEAAQDPVLYVTSLKEPNIPVAEVTLAPGKLMGAAVQSGRLVLLQDLTEYNTEEYWILPETQTLAARLYHLADPLDPVLMNEDIVEDIPYIGQRYRPNRDGDTIVWSSAASQYYPYLDYGFCCPGPWYGQSDLGYVVTQYAPLIDSIKITGWNTFGPEADWYSATGWFWEPPHLIASITDYTQYIRPDNVAEYKARSFLLAVDFTVPDEPVVLPRVKLPYNIAAIESLRDGINHFLYFEPRYNVLEVWGWDLASAFPLFKQELGPYDTANTSSYTLAWMPPFHMRGRYHYGNGLSRSHLDAWFHQYEANRFERVATFGYGDNEWLGMNAVMEPYFLQTTNTQVHFYKGDSANETFELVKSADVPLPSSYYLQLDGTVRDDGKAYIPAGLYGVEPIPYGPPDAIVRPGRFLTQLEATSPWSVISPSRWQLVDRESSGNTGLINTFQWLFRHDSMREVDALADDLGDLNRDSTWFGRYAHLMDNPSWIRHSEHGYQYVLMGDSPEADGLYLQDTGLGLLWTRADLYPWIYDIAGREWLYYFPGTGNEGLRVLYSFTTGWIIIP